MSKNTKIEQNNEVATIDSVKHSLATKSLLSAYLNENGEYIAKGTDKDGKLCDVRIKGENAYNSSALNVIADLESMSDKMKSYHISEIDEKQITLKGYKNKAEYVAKQSKKLSASQVSKLNRVGRIFLSHSVKNEDGSPVYEFRDGIPTNASITNLQECLSLLTDSNSEKLDFTACDKFSEKECEAIVKRFVALYIDTELLHPEATCKDFRDELKKIRNTNKSADTDNKDNTSSDNENGENDVVMSDKQYCISALATLTAHIVQDETILEKIGEIVEFINSYMSDETETETSAENETETE